MLPVAWMQCISKQTVSFFHWHVRFCRLFLGGPSMSKYCREKGRWDTEWNCHSKILRSAYVCCKPYIHFRNAKIGVLAREMRSQNPSYIALFIHWLVNTWLQQLLIGPLYKLNNPIETNLLQKRLRGTPLSSLQKRMSQALAKSTPGSVKPKKFQSMLHPFGHETENHGMAWNGM